MELKFIFSIKTKPGLYKALNAINGGFVAESLIDGHKERVVKGSAEAYCLANIKLNAEKRKIPLKEVFLTMQNHTDAPVDEKEEVEAVKAYFLGLFPDLDMKVFFVNDMRKLISWFNILNGKVNFSNNLSKATFMNK